MLRCAEHLVKTMVFEGFHFLNLFTDLESQGRVLGHFLVSFGDFFLIFRVLETGLKFDDF